MEIHERGAHHNCRYLVCRVNIQEAQRDVGDWGIECELYAATILVIIWILIARVLKNQEIAQWLAVFPVCAFLPAFSTPTPRQLRWGEPRSGSNVWFVVSRIELSESSTVMKLAVVLKRETVIPHALRRCAPLPKSWSTLPFTAELRNTLKSEKSQVVQEGASIVSKLIM
jgi:hypothetical protein